MFRTAKISASLFVACALMAGCGSTSETTSSSASETETQNSTSPAKQSPDNGQPAPSPSATSVEVAGPSAQVIEVVCPFVFQFLQEYPDVPQYGIAISTAGQTQGAALLHSMSVGRISSAIGQSPADSFVQLWLEVASTLSSPEYQSGQGVPNDAAASQALVSLNSGCIAALKAGDDSNDSAAKALKQASKACRNWPDIQIGVTKFTYQEPKNVRQRNDAVKAAQRAAKLDPKWNSLVGAFIQFNDNLGPSYESDYETDGWTDVDAAVTSASVNLDKECAIISALN